MSDQTISDPIALRYYQEGETELEATQSAEAVLRKAEVCGQQDARTDIMQSAFYYLAAAHFLENRNPATSAHAYQGAAFQLQRLQQSTQAGRAYSSAGKLAERAATAAPPDQFNSICSIWRCARIRKPTIVSPRPANWTALKRNISMKGTRGSPGPKCKVNIRWLY